MAKARVAILQTQKVAETFGLTLCMGEVLELRTSRDELLYSGGPIDIAEVVLGIGKAHQELGIPSGILY
jgi:hypothetical protein